MRRFYPASRSSRTAALRSGLAVLVAIAVAVSPVQAAFWYEAYEKAEEALAAEDWAEAIRQVNLALEKKGDSSARARTYGMNFIKYFPYYRLGVAYYNLGRKDEALQAFETEERLGAILQSEPDLAEMERFRGRIRQEQQDEAAQDQARIEEIVAESLTRAETLKNEGRLDEALGVLEQAIAVNPGHPGVNAARDELQAEVVRRRDAQDLERQVVRLVEEGRAELTAGRFQEAASRFSRAIDLDDTPEIRALLDDAQTGLRTEIQARESESRRRDLVDTGLRNAESLKEQGDYPRALSELEAIFAVEPGNARAVQLQAELFDLQNQSDRTASRAAQIRSLLDRARQSLDRGDYRDAVVASNQLLALEPDNDIATAYVSRAYRELYRRALGKNLPPILTVFGPNQGAIRESKEGVLAEVTRTPEFQLFGNAIDETRVSVEVFLGDEPLQVTRTPRPGLPGPTVSTNFSVSHRFAAPISFAREQLVDLRAVATDEEGVRSESRYAFLYVVPLHRWFWSYAGLAVALGAIAAIGRVRRVRRRNELVKRRFNPFIAGAPVLEDESFFGREGLMTRVMQTMHNNSILLYGERRIGKTSFQHRLKKRLEELEDPEYHFYPVFIDLQGTPQERFFATLAEEVFEELGPVLDGCEPDPSLHDGTTYQYRELVRDLRAAIKILQGRNRKRVKLTLLIDEVDELNNYDPRINQRLRSLFMRNFSENLVAVVSGVAIKKQWESEGSPWYNFFEEIEVKPFRREEAVELIENPIKGIFTLESGVVDKIIERTDCRPFLIQKLCVALVNRLHEERRRQITLADVEKVDRSGEA